MSEVKGKPQAPPMTFKAKTKKSMGVTVNSIKKLKNLDKKLVAQEPRASSKARV